MVCAWLWWRVAFECWGFCGGGLAVGYYKIWSTCSRRGESLTRMIALRRARSGACRQSWWCRAEKLFWVQGEPCPVGRRDMDGWTYLGRVDWLEPSADPDVLSLWLDYWTLEPWRYPILWQASDGEGVNCEVDNWSFWSSVFAWLPSLCCRRRHWW